MPNIQTLHNHTTNSDGSMTPQKFLKTAEKCGVTAVAFTDHDAILNKKQIEKIKNANIRWISGIEISSNWPEKIETTRYASCHIVGLFLDWQNKNLIYHCQKAQNERIERMKRIISDLKEIGIKTTVKKCLEKSKGESIGRSHIVAAILENEKNKKRMKEMLNEMKKAAKNDKFLYKKYEETRQKSIEKWAYNLFLRKDSYIKGIRIDFLYIPSFDKTIDLIKNAGGLTIFPHFIAYPEENHTIKNMLEKIISEKKLDGLEIIHSFNKYISDKKDLAQKSMKIAKQIAQKYNCVESGGIDAHNEKDLKQFSKNSEFNKKTTFLLENILKKFKVNTQFSNIKK